MAINHVLLLDDPGTSSLADRLEGVMSSLQVTRRAVREPQTPRLLQDGKHYDVIFVPTTTGIRNPPSRKVFRDYEDWRGDRQCIVAGYGIAPINGVRYDSFLATPDLMAAISPEAYLKRFLESLHPS